MTYVGWQYTGCVLLPSTVTFLPQTVVSNRTREPWMVAQILRAIKRYRIGSGQGGLCIFSSTAISQIAADSEQKGLVLFFGF